MRGLLPGMIGGGKPQRIISNSRTPSGAVRIAGALALGKMPGRGGMLPAMSRSARASVRAAPNSG